MQFINTHPRGRSEVLPLWGAPLPHLREGQGLATVEQTCAGGLLCSEGTRRPHSLLLPLLHCETSEPRKQCLSRLATELTLELGSSTARS